MRIDELAAWGEFIGGVAVVAGLFFVGMQLLAANREAKRAANQAYAEFFHNLGSVVSGSSEMADIWYRGLQGLDELTPIERVRFVAHVSSSILRTFEHLHIQSQTGSLADHIWNGVETTLKASVVNPGFVEVWDARRSYYSSSFQSYIDQLIAETTASTVRKFYDFSPEDESRT